MEEANTGFEDSMKRLEEIVSLLENPQISLEEGMKLFREGLDCSRYCRKCLNEASHQLEQWQEEEAIPMEEATDYEDET